MRAIFAALSLFVALFALAPAADAHPSKAVEWTKIEVRAGDDQKRLAKELKAALAAAVKKASFGKAKHVELTARLVDMETTIDGDVARVSCTLKGRVVGAEGARSRMSFGGSSKDKAALEKQVLTMVANGLVARLAQIARAKAEADE